MQFLSNDIDIKKYGEYLTKYRNTPIYEFLGRFITKIVHNYKINKDIVNYFTKYTKITIHNLFCGSLEFYISNLFKEKSY